MDEYIKRKAAIDAACDAVELYRSERDAIEDSINKIPAADVAPVRRGRWIPCENGGYHCSNCDHREGFIFNNKYCPNCGAIMNKGVNNG